MTYQNPILPGFYPDPSVCRVGEDYYLVTSSFEYFPSIPIFHSKDLVNWTQIGHAIEQNNQLQLAKERPNLLGMYAPTIRYHNGRFYVICTNASTTDIDAGNFYVYTDDINKGWSKPIFVDMPGIDPSLYFDDDGTVYYTGANEQMIWLAQLDIETGTISSDIKGIWAGSGGINPEGPHIYKKNGWYYLLISEGGTEYGHMITMARSKQIEGPYEDCPHNPVLTNRSGGYGLQAIGHADLFDDPNGNYWAVCLGIRTISYPHRHNLGRETHLVPVEWTGDWPVFGEDGHAPQVVETTKIQATQQPIDSFYDSFETNHWNPEWNVIYNPVPSLYNMDKGLHLTGNRYNLSDLESIAWVGRRQRHHSCIVTTNMSFDPKQDLEEAGLTIYMNNQHHYEIAIYRKNHQNYIIIRRQIGSLTKIEHQRRIDTTTITLEIKATKESYTMSYHVKGHKEVLGTGETIYLTTEVGGYFTGNYIAMYATGNGKESTVEAVFHDYKYQVETEKDNKENHVVV